MAKILEGKEESKRIIAEQTVSVSKLASAGFTVGFTMLAVGEDESVMQYALSNKRTCEKLGVIANLEIMAENSTTQDVIRRIEQLNSDSFINGIMVLTPLPKHIDTKAVLSSISAEKDIDAQSPFNVYSLYTNQQANFYPCTPYGAIRLMEHYKIDLDGKNVTVIGRSSIVGKPISLMLLNRNATVTICHTHTFDLKRQCLKADIIVACAGVPKMVKADMVKPGAIVFDIGTNFVDGKLCGDVDFTEVSKVAEAITPVPGGCGPMTVAIMAENIVNAAKRQHKIK